MHCQLHVQTQVCVQQCITLRLGGGNSRVCTAMSSCAMLQCMCASCALPMSIPPNPPAGNGSTTAAACSPPATTPWKHTHGQPPVCPTWTPFTLTQQPWARTHATVSMARAATAPPVQPCPAWTPLDAVLHMCRQAAARMTPPSAASCQSCSRPAALTLALRMTLDRRPAITACTQSCLISCR